MDLSVVIASFNARDYLRRCLTSLYAHTRDIDFEVIVVDNASWDGSPDLVEAEFPQAALIRSPGNLGFAAACNRGIAEAQGEFVLLLNPDTEVAENALAPMVAYCREHPQVGILGPRLLNSDGSLQLSCRRFPGHLTGLFNRQSLLTRLFPRNRFSARYLMSDWSHNAIAEVDWLSGACMMLRRSMLHDIGGMDEGFFMYIEDVDLCYRAHQGSYQVVYFPTVAVTHHIGRSSDTLPNRSVIQWHRSMWRYYRKHMRGNRLLDGLTLAGIGARCGYQLLLQNGRRLLAGTRRSS
jgi:GT2 family glycosyltransferase